MARAYATGDRAVLERAGLNYEALRAFDDPVSIGARIVDAVFDTAPDSTIENSEERDVAAAVAAWILESPAASVPTPEEIVRKSIELIILEVTLTEVGARIRAEASFEKRRAAEREIADAAEIYASQATLSPVGPSDREITAAIEGGIRELGQIFGDAE